MVSRLNETYSNDVSELFEKDYNSQRNWYRGLCRRKYPFINEEDFEDIFHDFIVSAIRYADKRCGNRRNWLETIFINHCRSYLRKSSRKPVCLSQINGNGMDEDCFPGKEKGPEENSVINERNFRIRKGVSQLEIFYRDTIELFYFSGYSIKDTGRILKIPVGTVKRRLHVARKRLGRMLTC